MAAFDNRNKKRPDSRSSDTEYKSEYKSDYKSGSNYKNNDSGKKTLTKVTCASCGKFCKVPFKPVSGKAVYCNDCFGKNNSPFKYDRESRSPFGNRYPKSESFNKKESSVDLEQINAKLDRILELLEE